MGTPSLRPTTLRMTYFPLISDEEITSRRPIRLIVGFPASTTDDYMARVACQSSRMLAFLITLAQIAVSLCMKRVSSSGVLPVGS